MIHGMLIATIICFFLHNMDIVLSHRKSSRYHVCCKEAPLRFRLYSPGVAALSSVFFDRAVQAFGGSPMFGYAFATCLIACAICEWTICQGHHARDNPATSVANCNSKAEQAKQIVNTDTQSNSKTGQVKRPVNPETRRLLDNKLCFECGKPGHRVKFCPNKQ